MRVWVYAICRDEKPIIGYFLRHYATFAENIIIYDDDSSDGTREEIAACPQAELRDWMGSDGLYDDEFLAFANEQWKEARGLADWVAWVDCDEFLYHQNILSVLERYYAEGVEVPQIDGYTMVSDHFPTTDGQIYDEIKTGFKDDIWSKKAIFRVHMHWNVGRHSIDTSQFTPVSSAAPEIKLLHYRALGLEYVKQRHRRNWERVPDRCRVMNMGNNTNPEYVGHHSVEWFSERIAETHPEVI